MDKFKILIVFLIKLDRTFRIQIENSCLSLGSSIKEIMTPKRSLQLSASYLKKRRKAG